MVESAILNSAGQYLQTVAGTNLERTKALVETVEMNIML